MIKLDIDPFVERVLRKICNKKSGWIWLNTSNNTYCHTVQSGGSSKQLVENCAIFNDNIVALYKAFPELFDSKWKSYFHSADSDTISYLVESAKFNIEFEFDFRDWPNAPGYSIPARWLLYSSCRKNTLLEPTRCNSFDSFKEEFQKLLDERSTLCK